MYGNGGPRGVGRQIPVGREVRVYSWEPVKGLEKGF